MCKFVYRTRNLAVADPAFAGTLDNRRDLILTFHEGCLKKICKDRNEKVVMDTFLQ